MDPTANVMKLTNGTRKYKRQLKFTSNNEI